MLIADSPLERAIKAITIQMAWKRLGLSGEMKRLCCVPWRDDRNPSLSIYDDDRMFKDHGTGDTGGVVKFVSLAADVSMSEAAKQLIEWNGGSGAYSPANSLRAVLQPVVVPVKKQGRKKLVIPAIDSGTIEELTTLSKARGLPVFAALELLNEREMFGFCNEDGTRCWVLTDPASRNAQVRPLHPDKAGWNIKAKSLTGSEASWPIGAACIEDADIVLLTEGTPDLLAATTAAWWETNAEGFDRIGFTCMTGANQNISREALPLFKDKQVKILGQNDQPGRNAVARWWEQLDPYAVDISAWMSEREGEDLNDYVRRCWEEMPENQTQWLPEKIIPENKEPNKSGNIQRI